VSISVVSRKLLWGRAGDRCSWPACTVSLTLDLHDSETTILAKHGVVIGEEAHIRSGRTEGPRYEHGFDRVDEYDNLILLCPTHHAIADKDGGAGWSVEALIEMKSEHEADVRARMDPTQIQARTLAEHMAAAVEYWATDLLDHWRPFTSQLLLAYPRLRESRLQTLVDRSAWLLAKDWPPGYPKIDAAFARWRSTVEQFTQHVFDTFEPLERNTDVLELVRGHKRLHRWDPATYERLFGEFLMNCVVAWWVVGELTRATNLVISAVRLELDPFYRFQEGLVLAYAEDLIGGDKLIRLEFDAPDWGSVGTAPNLVDIQTAIKEEAAVRGYDRYDDIDTFGLDVRISS
jgi:hypothetical protein